MVLPCMSFLTNFHIMGEAIYHNNEANEGNTDILRTINGTWMRKCGDNIVGSKHKHWQAEE